MSQLWVIKSWWKLHEECDTRIGLFRPKFIGIRFDLAEISQKKHLPNCSARGVLNIGEFSFILIRPAIIEVLPALNFSLSITDFLSKPTEQFDHSFL